MFNILTDSFKEHIRKEYQKRKIIVWLMIVIFLQVSFLLLMFPSYLYLKSYEKEVMVDHAPNTGTSSPDNTVDIAQVFRNTNNILSVLALSADSDGLHTLVSKIVTIKGSNIRLSRITYKSNTATSSVVTISGIAVNRDALLSFSKRLEADDSFNGIDLPVSNFAKDRNIEFSMKLNAHI